MDNRKRGIVLTNLFPNSVEKSRGVFVWQETMALRKHYDLKVIAPIPWVPPFLRNKPKYAYHAAYRTDVHEGIEIHHPRHVVIPSFFRILYGHLMFWGIRITFRKVTTDWHPEFMIVHYAFPDGYAGVRLARTLGVPIIVKVRGSDINVFTQRLFRRWMTIWTLRHADHVVTVSHALKSRTKVLGIHENRISVIRNGVNESFFHPRDRKACHKELGLEEEPFIFLFLGNMIAVKGIDVLLDAFGTLPYKTRSKARLILIGSGELDNVVINKINNSDLFPLVRKLPRVPHSDVSIWMGACDCLVLPSISEGYPNVLVEALAYHRPVVASRVGGIPEIVSDGKTGILIPPAVPDHLRGALLRIIVGFTFSPNSSPAWRRIWQGVAGEMSRLIDKTIKERAQATGKDSPDRGSKEKWIL